MNRILTSLIALFIFSTSSAADILRFDANYHAEVIYREADQIRRRICGAVGARASRTCVTEIKEVVVDREKWIEGLLRLFGLPAPYDSAQGIAALTQAQEVNRMADAARPEAAISPESRRKYNELQAILEVWNQIEETFVQGADAEGKLWLREGVDRHYALPIYAFAAVEPQKSENPKVASIRFNSQTYVAFKSLHGIQTGPWDINSWTDGNKYPGTLCPKGTTIQTDGTRLDPQMAKELSWRADYTKSMEPWGTSARIQVGRSAIFITYPPLKDVSLATLPEDWQNLQVSVECVGAPFAFPPPLKSDS